MKHYCEIENPVVQTPDSNEKVQKFGKREIRVNLGESVNIMKESEFVKSYSVPFGLLPGEVLVDFKLKV